MNAQALRAKYRKSKTRDAVNAAIRAELVGGDDTLDALFLVDKVANRLKDKGLAGQREARAALSAIHALRDVMANIIVDRS